MDLLLSLINITKSSSNALPVVATVLSAGGGRKRERESRRRRVVVVLEGQIAYLLFWFFAFFFFFFHFSRTIKISVLHACLTHTVRRPPPLFPLCVPPVVKSISLSLSL